MSKLSTEKLFLINPYDNKQIEMLKDFEKQNDIEGRISQPLEQLRSSITKEEYFNQKKEKNEIDETICLEKEFKIIDLCLLHIEKDIKIGKISLIPIKEHNKKLLSFVNDYAFNVLNVEEIFIEVDEKDRHLLSFLDNHNYENLGVEKGKILFLKEKQEEERSQRLIT